VDGIAILGQLAFLVDIGEVNPAITAKVPNVIDPENSDQQLGAITSETLVGGPIVTSLLSKLSKLSKVSTLNKLSANRITAVEFEKLIKADPLFDRLTDAEKVTAIETIKKFQIPNNNIAVLSIKDARRLQGENRGLIFVKEPPPKDITNLSRSEAFDAGTTGSFSEAVTGKRAVPALRFDRPNATNRTSNFVKFDGVEDNGFTLIDRKTSLTTRPKQIDAIRRASEAIKQNPKFKAIFEFPDIKSAEKATDILARFRITNITVRIAQ